MLLKTVLFVVGLSQVLALPTEPGYAEVDFIENVIKAEADAEDLDADPSSSRIVSGWQAYPGQHPHQIYLRMINAAGQLSACGGSVVHKNWFITAAHCTALRVQLLVRAGLVHINSPQYDASTTEWYNHPSYIDALPSVVQPNDISIAYLPESITFSHLVQPIKIQSSVDANRNYDTQVVIASGFGRTWTNGATSETLNWVYLNAVSNAACFATFGAIITDNTICARFFNVTSQSTCQGDSGGPLVHVDNDGIPILIGVASFVAGGESGCHSGHPAGFIRPGPFHSWFTEITGLDFEELDDEIEHETETEPPVTPDTEPPTPDTEPPTPEPPTTWAPEPPTTWTPEPPTTWTPEPPTRPPTTESPDSEEEDITEPTPDGEEDNSEEKDSDESDDCELSELLKKLEVKVSVKVKLNKYGKKIKKKN